MPYPSFFRLGPRELIKRETETERHVIRSTEFIQKIEKHDRSICSRLVGPFLFSRARIMEESISHPFCLSALARHVRVRRWMALSLVFSGQGKMYCISGRPVRGSHGPRKGKGKGKGGDSLTTPPPPPPPTPPDALLLFFSFLLSCLLFPCSSFLKQVDTLLPYSPSGNRIVISLPLPLSLFQEIIMLFPITTL